MQTAREHTTPPGDASGASITTNYSQRKYTEQPGRYPANMAMIAYNAVYTNRSAKMPPPHVWHALMHRSATPPNIGDRAANSAPALISAPHRCQYAWSGTQLAHSHMMPPHPPRSTLSRPISPCTTFTGCITWVISATPARNTVNCRSALTQLLQLLQCLLHKLQLILLQTPACATARHQPAASRQVQLLQLGQRLLQHHRHLCRQLGRIHHLQPLQVHQRGHHGHQPLL